jgi:hypothetical protein
MQDMMALLYYEGLNIGAALRWAPPLLHLNPVVE